MLHPNWESHVSESIDRDFDDVITCICPDTALPRCLRTVDSWQRIMLLRFDKIITEAFENLLPMPEYSQKHSGDMFFHFEKIEISKIFRLAPPRNVSGFSEILVSRRSLSENV